MHMQVRQLLHKALGPRQQPAQGDGSQQQQQQGPEQVEEDEEALLEALPSDLMAGALAAGQE